MKGEIGVPGIKTLTLKLQTLSRKSPRPHSLDRSEMHSSRQICEVHDAVDDARGLIGLGLLIWFDGV